MYCKWVTNVFYFFTEKPEPEVTVTELGKAFTQKPPVSKERSKEELIPMNIELAEGTKI